MQRIMVVGTSCSGKTTLARCVAATLDVPHVELDALHWGPGWSQCPLDEFREVVREHTRGSRWVVDGNYGKVRDIVLARATDAIWLNYSFPVVFGRALSRTGRRVVSGEELFGGNRETFRSAFLSGDSIPWWVLRTYRGRKREYRELFSTGAGSKVRLTELRRQRDADRLLDLLRGAV
ncbi:MAG: adenylate kinase [Candidatus Eisenbacteria bacterium]|nr:adenylate kinase [Candidatus Eisenbacteria bacterium]